MAVTRIPPEAAEAQLKRIVESDTFRGAERSRTLLRFVVEEALRGRADRLKDYTLGSEALGRGEGFDPRVDPIARVEASRLRSRLDVYYATEGASDPIRIGLPKGGYAPVFDWRTTGATVSVTQAPAGEQSAGASAAAVRRRWTPGLVMGAATAIALTAGLSGWLRGRAPEEVTVPETRLQMSTPATTDSASLSVSPDGRAVVFVATAEGRSRLWVRPLASFDARELAGTDYASLPFWAPDGRSIGFFADGRLKRIDLGTGLVHAIATALRPAGAAWNRDGVILYTVVPDGPLFRTSVAGSAGTAVTELEPGQNGHRSPVFLPDGRHFLFYAMGSSPAVRGIYVGDLDTGAIRRVTDADSPAVFAPPDHLLYVQHSTLFARRIDPRTVTVRGDPTPVAEGISIDATSGVAALSASAGTIAYRSGQPAGKRQLVWVDRTGKELSRIGSPVAGGPSYASLSPDGGRLAVQRSVSGNTDILLMDVERGTPMRFTTVPQPDIAPIWSPQGDRIVYASAADGVFQLFEKAIDGTAARLLLSTPEQKQVTDWSRDGRYLLFRTVTITPETDIDIWALPLDGDRKPFPVVRTPFEERDAQFSPDGRWIAYHSNEYGLHDIYVQPFNRAGERMRISNDGGVQARWRSDGRELFYLTLDGRLVAVPIEIRPDGSLRAGTAVPLFQSKVGPVQAIPLHSYIAPAPDGSRFLVEQLIEEPAAPISVILNWKAPGG